MLEENGNSTRKIMKPMTKDVVNFASAERGRVLITDNEIRLQFDTREQAIRFVQAIMNAHPDVRLKTNANWKSIDVSSPELSVAS